MNGLFTKKIKLFLVFALVSVFSVGVSGCEKKNPQTGLLGNNESAEFQIWTTKNSTIFQALAQEFVSQTQTKNLQIKIVPFASQESLETTLVNKMAEGLGPDLIFADGDWIKRNQQKLLALIQDATLTPTIFGNTFVRAATQTLTTNKGVYGVPMSSDSLALIYNKEHLIDNLESRNTSAQTWNEFAKDTQELSISDNSFQRFKVSGAAIGRSDNIRFSAEVLRNIMLQKAVTFFSGKIPEFASTSTIDPETRQRENVGVSALNFLTQFSDKDSKFNSWNKFMAEKNSKEKELKTFAEGKTSQVFGFAEDLETIEELIAKTPQSISPENIGVGSFPQALLSQKEIFAHIRALVVPRTAPRPQISWKFLKFIMQKENQAFFMTKTGSPTARLDLLSEQSADPVLGVFSRQAKLGRAPLFPISVESFDADLEKVIEEVSEKRLSSQKGLMLLQTKISKDIQEQQKIEKSIVRPAKGIK